MKEDIKILKKLVNNYNEINPNYRKGMEIIISNNEYKDIILAIENLIAKYKELEKYKKYYETEKVIWSRKDYIKKSKVKEKIEELRNEKYDDITFKYNKIEVNGIIEVILQELLQD